MKLTQTTISLSSKYLALIEELINSGRYPCKGEFIRVAIRRAIKRDKERLLILEKK